jgi:hypothetical protein
MRKVLFKKIVNRKVNPIVWSDFIYSGIFHQWGNAYEEFENGPGNYTTAIVELPDGTIEELLPFCIKFITDESTPNSPVDAGEQLPNINQGEVQSDSQVQQGDNGEGSGSSDVGERPGSDGELRDPRDTGTPYNLDWKTPYKS